MNSLLKILQKIFISIFGNISYEWPSWARFLGQKFINSKLGQKTKDFFFLRNSNPRKFWSRIGVTIFSLAVIAGGSYWIYNWWQSRPRPVEVTFRVDKPGVTDLQTNEPDALVIRFSQSVAKMADMNKPLLDRIQIKPEIKGTWSWTQDDVLMFKPDFKSKVDWKVGTEYEVEFKRTLFADHIRIEKLEFDFKTPELTKSLVNSEFYIDPKNPKIKRGLFKVYFNQPVLADDIKNRIKLTIAAESGIGVSKNVDFTVQLSPLADAVFINSDALVVEDRPQTLTLSIDKGVKPKRVGESLADAIKTQLAIPGRLTAFKIDSVSMEIVRNQKYEPEQVIMVTTSLETTTDEVAQKLKLSLLPQNRPATSFDKEYKNYPWSSASEVTEEIRNLAQKLETTTIPSENDYSKVHSFKILSKPEQYVLVEIEKGLKSLGDFELAESQSSVVKIKPYPEEISIMSEGSLLTLSGELKVPLMARNVRQVEVEVSRVIPEQVNHLLSQISYDMKSPYIYDDMKSKISENFTTTLPLAFESAQATQFFSYDIGQHLHKSGLPKGVFLFKVTVLRPDKSRGRSDHRLIMVSDMGLLVKETQGQQHEVFVQNFKTGLPVKGAKIEVVGRNGLAVVDALTDERGHVKIANLKDFRREKEPIAFSVRSGNDQAFIPYRLGSGQLQYNRFDIGGLTENAVSEQLQTMFFSDRGLYRPAEMVHLGLIIRSKSVVNKESQIPLEWSVTDPKGNTILKEKITVSSDDFKTLEFKTDETSPVGTYTVHLHLIKKFDERVYIKSHEVKVQEFQPDRIKIRTALSKEKSKGWIKTTDLQGFVNLRNLFGSPAENRIIRAKMTLNPYQPQFKGFEGYKFNQFDFTNILSLTENLKEIRTDAKGEATFDLPISKYQSPYFSVYFNAEGFEGESGQSVQASSMVYMSPLDFIVGGKPDGSLDYIKRGSVRNIELIAIDSDLNKVAAQDLNLEIIERKYVSVLTQDDSGVYKYQSVLKQNTLKTEPLKISAKGQNFKINSDLAGDYFLVVKDKAGQELLKLAYTVASDANIARSLDRNAELQVVLNKKDFKNGEEIEMQIKAPYQGAGLITIERDGIYEYKWFKTETTSTIQKIKVPENLDGNAYVNVTFLRAFDSKEIFMSPLSYAVVPFSISLDDKKTKINLVHPEKIKPGQKLTIKYSTNVQTELILYGVDEGILQVAQYKLPDPLGYFFQKRALQVRTYQMLDLIMPEFSLIQQNQATGGDDSSALGQNLNPFRSKKSQAVAFWSGVLKSGPEAKSYTYEVPDYFNGNIKIMAVAANSRTLGSTSAESLVKGDFIITPSAPFFVAPLDEFKIGLTVSNQKEKSGDKAVVKLKATPNALIKMKDKDQVDLTIPEGREVATAFFAQAEKKLGAGEILFEATHENSKSKARVDLSVRPATVYQNDFVMDFTDKNNVSSLYDSEIYENFAKFNATASASPLALGVGLRQYLEVYPYGCTEQLVSQNWPFLMTQNFQSEKLKKEKVTENINSIIRVLRSRQTLDGGFTLYERSAADTHAYASLHAIEFLLDLHERRLADVKDMLNKATGFLNSLNSMDSQPSLNRAREWAYSLYLLSRMKIVDGASLTALKAELKENKNLVPDHDVTWAFIAATHKIYKQDQEAESLFKNLNMKDSNEPVDYSLHYIDSLSSLAIKIQMLATYGADSFDKKVNVETLRGLVEFLKKSQYQSYSSARLLLAFDAIESRSKNQPLKVEFKAILNNQEKLALVSKNTGAAISANVPFNAKGVELNKIEGGNLFYSVARSGFPLGGPLKEIKNNIEISRTMKNEKGEEISKVQVGQEVTVTLAVRSIDQKIYPHMAIVELLPGGFELIVQDTRQRLDTGAEEEYNESQGGEGDYEEGVGTPRGDEAEPEPVEEENSEGALFNLFIRKSYAQVQTQLKELYTEFVDQREDRLVIYATVTADAQSYTYKMKAISEGQFVWPGAFAEHMYDKSIKYVGTQKTIQVLGESK